MQTFTRHRPHLVSAAGVGLFDGCAVQIAPQRPQQRCRFAGVGFNPNAGFRQLAVNQRQDFRVVTGIGAGGQVIALIAGDTLPLAQHAGVLLALGAGDERLPGHPGIHLAGLKRGAAVRRRQIGRRNVFKAQMRLGQRGDQEIVTTRRFGDRDALAFQLRQRG